MIFAFLLGLASVGGGLILTYVYDDESIFWVRLCAGTCTGLAALGLIGFIFASWLGMTPLTLILAGGATALPFLLLQDRSLRARAANDIYQAIGSARRAGWGILMFYLAAVVLFWCVCDHAMYENASGVFTGFDTNIGDLPFHIAITSGFAYGENFPPQHPEFAGVPLTYPFLMDFVTAMFVSAGATLRSAFFWPNYAIFLALTGLLHQWALKLTGDRGAALLTPVLIFLSGGFGWITLLREAARGEGLAGLIGKLPHDYTVGDMGYRWANAITALFVPQRGFLLGVALAILVLTLLWQSPRRPVAAGLIAGLLPLVHAHSFAVVMAVGPWLIWTGPAHRRAGRSLLLCVKFLGAAALLGLPQILWAASGSALQAATFLAWQPGWDHGTDNAIWFWFKNTGFFIPMLVVSLLWVVRRPLVYFYLPFTLCFIVPNLFRLSPWIWDNIKILFFWWIASAPLAALLLSRLWRERRVIAVCLLLTQISAGALDVWRGASGMVERQIFDPAALHFAAIIRSETPPQSLILTAPTYNHPVYLAGRRTFMGYDGHLWSHGLDYTTRLDELKRIYSGAPEAGNLLAKNRVDYVVVGPLENSQLAVNHNFFEHYSKVGAAGDYSIYKSVE